MAGRGSVIGLAISMMSLAGLVSAPAVGAESVRGAAPETPSAMAVRSAHGDATDGSVDAHGRGQSSSKTSRPRTTGISYHGGPVMVPVKHAYVIFYGTWPSSAATSIISDYLNGVGGSPYFNINTTYTDASGHPVLNAVSLVATTTDNYSRGTSFADASVLSIVTAAITSGRLPNDPAGVYIVAASSDVKETSGFGSAWCGWHDHATVGGSDIKYAFTEDTSRVMTACAAQSTSPNGFPGVDAEVNIIAHELEEATTDPDLNAWYDSRGLENADKCAWTFGTTATAVNGSKYNVTLAGRQYLIQQNWVNASAGSCALKYP